MIQSGREVQALPINGLDANGDVFPIEKMDAHIRSVKHLAVSVFVLDGEYLLIQRRADSKYHCGGLWANTCCTHPYWTETSDHCAERRMQEELGARVPLRQVSVFEYSVGVTDNLWENERVSVFTGSASRQQLHLDLNPAEVAETRWATLPELRLDVQRRPEDFAPWFRIYLQRWSELGLPSDSDSRGGCASESRAAV